MMQNPWFLETTSGAMSHSYIGDLVVSVFLREFRSVKISFGEKWEHVEWTHWSKIDKINLTLNPKWNGYVFWSKYTLRKLSGYA